MKKLIVGKGNTALAIFGLFTALLLAGCGDDPTGSTDLSPTAADFDISGVTDLYEAGDTVDVKITAKDGKTEGAVTIWYEGIDPTSYTKSKTSPTEEGAYAVTFDVAAATGWKAVNGLTAGTLTINPADPNKVVMPAATPPAGAVASGATVTLSTTTTGAEIWYTTDGNTPEKDGATSTKYVSPIAITEAVTIKAIAVKDDMTDSNILTAAYTIDTGAPCTHQWEWKVSTPATLTENGEETETCSICDETKGEPRTILSLKSILEAAEGGDSADDPITVPLKLDLGNMAQAGSNWLGLLAALNEAGKYVALDLSACTLTGTEFNTGVTSSSKPDGMDYIVSVVLPDSVTSIGNYVFWNCSSLENITIPDGVTSIGTYAFNGCTSLESITIPDSVTSIGDGAFNGTGLTSVAIPNGVTRIGFRMFNDCTSLESITIPDSVTSIDSQTFVRCTSLKSIIIPNSVTSIGGSAFAYCTNLTSVTIGENVTLDNTDSIVDAGFYTAYNDTFGTVPGTYTRENSGNEWIWKGGNGSSIIVAFHSMGGTYINARTGLQSGASVNAPGAPDKDGYTLDAWYTDFDCTTAANFPMMVTADIILYAGWTYNETPLYTWLMDQPGGNSADDPVTIPKGQLETDLGNMTAVGSNWNKLLTALAEAGKYVNLDLSACALTGTTFSTGVDGNGKPKGMDNIVSIVLPDSVMTIGAYAFFDCTSLTNVTIGDSVTRIDDWVFYGCTGLTSVTIPNSVTNIGLAAFQSCSSLESVTIGDSVTSIGGQAFAFCSNLASIAIPDSVTRIGYSAFINCTGLASVTIGDSVTSIGNTAFYGCSNLVAVICLAEEPPTLETSVFDNTDSSLEIKVPAASVEAYKAAWSEYAERIEAID